MMWRTIHQIKRYLATRLWIRPALASILSLLVVSVGVFAGRTTGIEAPIDLTKDALNGVLTIFASSMLAVATFSVSAVVTAVSTVAGSTTPRATRLILDDSTTQNVLASFISAFIYSIIAIIAMEVVPFTAMGRLVIFACFCVLVGWVLVTFLGWVDHVTRLGQMSNTINRISEFALQAAEPEHVGTFGARPYDGTPPVQSVPVTSNTIGFVSDVHVEGLQKLAEDFGCSILLQVRPGDLVDHSTPMAHIVSAPSGSGLKKISDDIQNCVVVEWSRNHQTDFRFGLINLAETADRALSPGVNDPGTAIVILGRLLEALSHWNRSEHKSQTADIVYDRVGLPQMTARDVVKDSFTAIARDGAGSIEVGVRLQKTFQSLVKLGNAPLTEAVVEMSAIAAELADKALVVEQYKVRIADEARRVVELSRMPLHRTVAT